MSIKVKILKVYLSRKNFQTKGMYIYLCIFMIDENSFIFNYSLSRKDYESDNNIKIDLEGSDFEANENQGKVQKKNVYCKYTK